MPINPPNPPTAVAANAAFCGSTDLSIFSIDCPAMIAPSPTPAASVARLPISAAVAEADNGAALNPNAALPKTLPANMLGNDSTTVPAIALGLSI